MNIPINELYDLFLKHRRISTDSRKIEKGALFFALKGEKFDGNKFALEALQRGASYAIVDEPSIPEGLGIIKTGNALGALQDLARFHRSKLHLPVIGITGTNGKTTTKELVYAVLARKFRTFATEGNLNNHIGVPLSILSIERSHEIAVVEMGANHTGEISSLCDIADPDQGLITNVGKAHIEGFGSFEGVVKAKTELYRYLKGKGGRAFVNLDDEMLMHHAADLDKKTYGQDPLADCRTRIGSEFPFLQVSWFRGNQEIPINTQIFGSYNLYNIAAAICIGDHFGLVPEDIRAGIEGYVPHNSRSEFMQTRYNKVYMDAYNANPSSMELAIRDFDRAPLRKKMLIIGDMMELGNTSREEHLKVIKLIRDLKFKKVIYVGPYFKQALDNDGDVFDTVELARKWLGTRKIKDHAILVKGSRKIELEKLLDVL